MEAVEPEVPVEVDDGTLVNTDPRPWKVVDVLEVVARGTAGIHPNRVGRRPARRRGHRAGEASDNQRAPGHERSDRHLHPLPPLTTAKPQRVIPLSPAYVKGLVGPPTPRLPGGRCARPPRRRASSRAHRQTWDSRARPGRRRPPRGRPLDRAT